MALPLTPHLYKQIYFCFGDMYIVQCTYSMNIVFISCIGSKYCYIIMYLKLKMSKRFWNHYFRRFCFFVPKKPANQIKPRFLEYLVRSQLAKILEVWRCHLKIILLFANQCLFSEISIHTSVNFKVHIFWEGHKILTGTNASQKKVEISQNFCNLLRIYDL